MAKLPELKIGAGQAAGDAAFKALLRSSHPDPLVRSKIIDLKDKFRDAFTGWLELEEAA